METILIKQLTETETESIFTLRVSKKETFRKEMGTVTDYELLQSRIKDSGMTMTAIAKKSGICRPTLCNRLKGRGRFYDYEIEGLAKTLRLTNADRDRIFFAKKVGK